MKNGELRIGAGEATDRMSVVPVAGSATDRMSVVPVAGSYLQALRQP